MSGINFIIESGISLAALSLIYGLFMRQNTFFRVNRGFLLFSVIFSIILPFTRFRVFDAQPMMLPEITVSQYRGLLETVTIYSHGLTGSIERSISSATLLIIAYFAGLTFFLGRFVFRIGQLVWLIRQNKPIKKEGYYIVQINQAGSPFSFMNYIFIQPSNQKQEHYQKLIAHELEHIRQGHSIDILILEVLTLFQWFNPFMWMLKRAVKENHEYLADQGVLTKGVNRGQYKLLLLQEWAGEPVSLTNGFNSSMIKNRIKMMSKIRSSKLANTKLIAGVLAVAALLIVFACEQKKSANVKQDAASGLITSFENGKLKFEGSHEELAKVREMFSDENSFDISENDSLGYVLVTKKEIRTIQPDEEIFFVVEQMPEFPGGDTALRQFIMGTVKYPVDAQKAGIQGKVYVSFVVSADGYVANAKIAKSVSPLLDKEALRVVNSMPVWKPGYQRGKAVNVSFTIPINFVLR